MKNIYIDEGEAYPSYCVDTESSYGDVKVEVTDEEYAEIIKLDEAARKLHEKLELLYIHHFKGFSV